MEAFSRTQAPFLPFQEANIPAIANIFRQWRTDLPNIETSVQGAIMGIDFSDKTKAIITTAARLTTEPANKTCLYHDNMHGLQIFFMTYTTGKLALERGIIDKNTFGNMLAAALIHDYKHDGTANNGIQFRLEKIAFKSAKDALQNAGATPDDLKMIKGFVLATDTSKDFNDQTALSPAESLKKHIKDGDTSTVFEELQWLVKNSTQDNNFVVGAVILQGCDIGCSPMDREICEYDSQRLAKERGEEYEVNRNLFFLNEICADTFSLLPELKILEPFFEKTKAEFEQICAVCKPKPALL